MKHLFRITALIEGGTGLAILVAPTAISQWLLGVPLNAQGTHTATQIIGATLLSIGLACWLARDDFSSRSGQALLSAITLYNISAIIIFLYARFGHDIGGLGLWPAVFTHIVMGGWCIRNIFRS